MINQLLSGTKNVDRVFSFWVFFVNEDILKCMLSLHVFLSYIDNVCVHKLLIMTIFVGT